MQDQRSTPEARRDTDEDLMFDIAMSLRGAPLRKDADKGVLARRIVEHLRLCRWRWWREAPEEAHGTFTRDKQ